MAKILLETGAKDEDIFNAKINLAEELKDYDKVKNNEQIKALVDFLEYLFLINDEELDEKYNEYKRKSGGVYKMTIEEIRKKYYTQKGREEGKIEMAIEMLKDGETIEKIVRYSKLTEEEVKELKKNL